MKNHGKNIILDLLVVTYLPSTRIFKHHNHMPEKKNSKISIQRLHSLSCHNITNLYIAFKESAAIQKVEKFRTSKKSEKSIV